MFITHGSHEDKGTGSVWPLVSSVLLSLINPKWHKSLIKQSLCYSYMYIYVFKTNKARHCNWPHGVCRFQPLPLGYTNATVQTDGGFDAARLSRIIVIFPSLVNVCRHLMLDFNGCFFPLLKSRHNVFHWRMEDNDQATGWLACQLQNTLHCLCRAACFSAFDFLKMLF